MASIKAYYSPFIYLVNILYKLVIDIGAFRLFYILDRVK